MATSKSQMLAVAKFRAEKCDRIAADVPKGKREVYNAAAKELNLSLAKLIQAGVEEYIANHAGEVVTVKPENQLSAEERRLLDEFNQLPGDAQKHLLKFVKAVNKKGGGEND